MSKTLLLADDSVTIQKVVGISFANEDVTLVTVDNGDAALERVNEVRPDVVLADVVMPGKSGYEVCEAIKNDPALRHTPVLLLTGTFEAFDEDRAQAVGADGHITKPFEAQALVDQVNALLARATAPAAQSTPEPVVAEAAPAAEPVVAAAAPAAEPVVAETAPTPEPVVAVAPPTPEPAQAAPEPIAAAPVVTESPMAIPMPPRAAAPEGPAAVDPASVTTVFDAPTLPPEQAGDSYEFFEQAATDPGEPLETGVGELETDADELETEASDLETDMASPPSFSFDSAPDLAADMPSGVPAAPTGSGDETMVMPAGGFGFDAAETAPEPPPPPTAAVDNDATIVAGVPLAAPPPVPPAIPEAPVDFGPLETPIASVSHGSASGLASEAVIDPAGGRGYDVSSSDLGDTFRTPVTAAAAETEEITAPQRVSSAPPPVPTATVVPVATAGPEVGDDFRQEVRDAVEKIAWEAFGQVTEKLVEQALERVEKIAWEVIPQLAETLVKEEIRKLKGD